MGRYRSIRQLAVCSLFILMIALPLTVPTIVAADPCGETITADGTYDGQWSPGCESEARTGSHARYYTFNLGQDSEVVITLTRTSGEADTYLYLWAGADRAGTPVAFDDDSPDVSRSEITRSLGSGTYTIEATTYNAGETGDFNLSVSGLSGTAGPPHTDECEETITPDGTYDGQWSPGCESEARTGSHARYYTFNLEQQSDVTITLERTSGSADTYLYLREGAGRTGTVIDSDDDSPDASRSEISRSLSGGDYTIEATTYNLGETGDFTLTISAGQRGATPDLVVIAPSVRDGNPPPGEPITLSVTVHNRGGGPADFTTLRYYHSSDSTISADDTQVEEASVGGLPASESSRVSVNLKAPSVAGTYYGACVDPVAGEFDTGNNCSGAVAVTVHSPVADATDRAALVALYNAAGGTYWDNNTNWLSDAPLGDWHGVRTDASGRVVALDLRYNGLTGIPPELGNLANLKSLNLGGNGLTGIPPELGNLASLESLDLWYTGLTGIPPELGNLANLKSLNLYGNQLTGIPGELGNLASLESLYLTHNQLTGIPPELGNLASLESLNLEYNELTGIPGELGNLASLESLYLTRNQLTGEIPPELGSLASLKWLDLSDNQLTGEIPAELFDIEGLLMSLWGNQLGGTAPFHQGERDVLTVLYNATDGPGWYNNTNWLSDAPVFTWYGVGIFTDGRVGRLNLSGRQLSGEIPPELGNLTRLESLDLGYNRLLGEIPGELGNLTSLRHLNLGGNQLTGIPAELGNLARLETLLLQAGRLSGEIPTELGNLSSLRHLNLGSNQLTGGIPPELGNLTNLEDLWLGYNQLTGGIPPELGNLTSLENLSLNNNQLTGEIPAELGNLANLEWLWLNNNQLTGEIPPELGNLASLQSLDLSGNQLTGCIPAGLRDIPYNDFDQLNLDFCAEMPVIDPCVEDLGTLTSIITLTGGWSSDCASDNRSGSYTQYYTFTLDVETHVQIDLASSQDSYLYLMQGTIDGPIVTRDGDGGPGRDARISRNLGTMSYFIEVTTYNAGETGDFTLTIIPSSGGPLPIPDLGCSLGSPTTAHIAGSWTSDCPANNRGGSYARYYSFELSQEAQVTIDLASSLDTVVYLLEGAGTGGYVLDANDDDRDVDTTNSRIVATLPAGTYTVEATTYTAGQTGSFILNVIARNPVDPCMDDLGTFSPQGRTGALLPGTWTRPCGSTHQRGRYSHFYTFTLALDSSVTINLTKNSGDGAPHLYLRSGTGKDGSVLAENDNYQGNRTESQIEKTLTAGQSYTIEAAFFDYNAEGGAERGRFTLNFTVADVCLRELGVQVPGQTGFGVINGGWTVGCPSTRREGSYAQYYTFMLIKSGEVTIDLESDVDTFLYLLEGKGREGDFLVANDDAQHNAGLASNTDSRITRTLDAETYYTIEATTYQARKTGRFDLDITVPLLVAEGSQRAALIALYAATDGDNWYDSENWGDNTKVIGEWYGVTTDKENLVIGLSLSHNRLNGELPADLPWDALYHLDWLNLDHNRLDGSIPEELGQLENLEVLSLNNNQLSGRIPLSLSRATLRGGNLANLRWLNLEHNLLEGPIPGALGTLSNLEALGLGHNRLSGTIPLELSTSHRLGGDLSKLRLLYLANQDYCRGTDGPGGCDPEEANKPTNYLHGGIPNTLGSLTNLKELSLARNRLEGTIPSNLALLPHLDHLNLRQNELSGGIRGLAGLSSDLNELRLSGNQFGEDDCIPIELRDIPNNDLEQLGLEPCTDQETDREALLAFYRDMNGSNWKEGGDGHTLEWEGELYRVSGNQSNWKGVWLDEDNRVTHITLGGNGLVDLIAQGPSGRSALEHLQHLYRLEGVALQDNDLSGTIPESLGNLSSLETLNLSNNNLSGTIPESLGNLSNLGMLLLRNNNLSGGIPSILARLPGLRSLTLKGNNSLTGCIPVKLQKVGDLEELGLPSCGDTANEDYPALRDLYNSTNGDEWRKGAKDSIVGEWLVGHVENWHGVHIATDGDYHPLGDDCEGRVVALILYNNNLVGEIPESLGDGLPCLLWLQLNGNKLSGPIPDSLGNFKSLQQDDQGQCAHSGYYVYAPVQGLPYKGQRILRLGRNNLSGEIPASLGNLKCMTQLDLGSNKTGPVYIGGGRATYHNGLEGVIPSTFSNLTQLIYLNLSGNQLQAGVEYVFPQADVSEGDVPLELVLGDNNWVPEYEGLLDDFAQTVAGIAISEIKGHFLEAWLEKIDERTWNIKKRSQDAAERTATLAAQKGKKRAASLIRKGKKFIPGLGQYITVFEGLQFAATFGKSGSIPCGPISCQDWHDLFHASGLVDAGARILSDLMQTVDPITCVASVAPGTLDANNCPTED